MEGEHKAQWAKDDTKAERSEEAIRTYIFIRLILVVIYIVCSYVDQWQYSMFSISPFSVTGMEVYMGLTGGRFIMDCGGSIKPHAEELFGRNHIVGKLLTG